MPKRKNNDNPTTMMIAMIVMEIMAIYLKYPL